MTSQRLSTRSPLTSLMQDCLITILGSEFFMLGTDKNKNTWVNFCKLVISDQVTWEMTLVDLHALLFSARDLHVILSSLFCFLFIYLIFLLIIKQGEPC
jgi:hypothetical protein